MPPKSALFAQAAMLLAESSLRVTLVAGLNKQRSVWRQQCEQFMSGMWGVCRDVFCLIPNPGPVEVQGRSGLMICSADMIVRWTLALPCFVASSKVHCHLYSLEQVQVVLTAPVEQLVHLLFVCRPVMVVSSANFIIFRDGSSEVW